MSRIRTVADPDTPIEIAVQRMANQGIRRLPIMQEGKVVGIITVTDLARYLRRLLLLEGALDSDKAAGFWSGSTIDNNNTSSDVCDNISHNDNDNDSNTAAVAAAPPSSCPTSRATSLSTRTEKAKATTTSSSNSVS
jgi:hypothetical protein